jgi:Fe2+ or Zn2+ uptake regulation protein
MRIIRNMHGSAKPAGRAILSQGRGSLGVSEALRAACLRRGVRLSRGAILVLACMEQAHGPLDINDIAAWAASAGRRVARTSIYRAARTLSEAGVLVELADGRSRRYLLADREINAPRRLVFRCASTRKSVQAAGGELCSWLLHEARRLGMDVSGHDTITVSFSARPPPDEGTVAQERQGGEADARRDAGGPAAGGPQAR